MKDNRIPSPFISLLPVFVLILLLFVTIRVFGSDALSGGSQVCLLTATAVCAGSIPTNIIKSCRKPWKNRDLRDVGSFTFRMEHRGSRLSG